MRADARVAISVTDRNGRVTARLDGEPTWDIIDRISRKYTGQPYPLRADRVVFLIEPEHAHAQAFG